MNTIPVVRRHRRARRLPGLPGRIAEALAVLRRPMCPECRPVAVHARRVLLGAAPPQGVEQ